MAILFGTQDGVYRSSTRNLTTAERVLDAGPTLEVSAIDGHGVFAASKTGLYRSLDTGTTWKRCAVPQTEVFSVTVSTDGDRIYAGTHPAHVYVSTDGGETWSDLDGFQSLPSRHRWHTPRHRGASHVRSIVVHSDEPDRVIAGVEVGGVHISEDRGRTWTERRSGLEFDRGDGLQFDVHHLLAVDAAEFVVSCGGGLYRTSDAGIHWTRLEFDPNRPYVSESFQHGARLYTAAQTLPPHSRWVVATIQPLWTGPSSNLRTVARVSRTFPTPADRTSSLRHGASTTDVFSLGRRRARYLDGKTRDGPPSGWFPPG